MIFLLLFLIPLIATGWVIYKFIEFAIWIIIIFSAWLVGIVF